MVTVEIALESPNWARFQLRKRPRQHTRQALAAAVKAEDGYIKLERAFKCGSGMAGHTIEIGSDGLADFLLNHHKGAWKILD